MRIERRTFLAGTAAIVAVGPAAAMNKGHTMYGLIGKMKAQAGKRSALTGILVKGVAGMPGCLSYVVADDPAEANVIWITALRLVAGQIDLNQPPLSAGAKPARAADFRSSRCDVV